MPRAFERAHAGEANGGHPVERKQFCDAKQQHDEQKRKAEDRRRIYKRQPQRRHDEQQERKHDGARGQNCSQISRRGKVVAEFDPGLQCVGLECLHQPNAYCGEENRERAEQEK